MFGIEEQTIMNLPTPLPPTQTSEQAKPFRIVVEQMKLELEKVNGPIKRFSFDSSNIEPQKSAGYFVFLLQYELEGDKYALWAYMARYADKQAN